VKRLLAALALIGLAGGAWQAAIALHDENATEAAPQPPQPSADTPPAATAPASPAAPPLNRATTPMRQRVAVLGLLNKRNGISRDLRMHPGDAVRVGDVIVRLRACETTAPWEPEKLTGAFVQVDVHGRDDKWRRVFSGWLYKESPSLNVVEHPVYDVWPKSCEMKHPEIGPDTVSAAALSASGASRSSAKKSPDAAAGAAEDAAAKETPTPSASSSNAT
jgi:hypothetical protein